MTEYPTSGHGPNAEDGGTAHVLQDPYPVAELSLDEIFGLLSNQRRRHAIRAFRDGPRGAVDLLEAADQIAEWEGMVGERPPVETVATTLHHVHLPMLDDAGIIDYDARSRAARYWGHPVVEEYLEHVEPIEFDE
jgi:hypothetical protein